jgi:Winged helix DNA-binding domain
MDPKRLQVWWSVCQGLDGSLQGKSAGEVLRCSGWARSVAGVGPYLTLYARAGISRAEADRAVANLEIHELPAARGCTYVVPAKDFALALKVGSEFAAAPMKVAAKLGVTEKEIDKLCAAVLKTLEKGPLDPEGIREATGKTARNLGEAGKKKGVTTTLPLALGLLQAAGDIRRVPTNGRLDQQRYRYTLWRDNPVANFPLTLAEAHTELARRFFSWIGPATLAEFQWFSGMGVQASKAALAPLPLVPLENDSPFLIFKEDRDKLLSMKVPAKPQYTLVSSLDAISALRRDYQSLLAAGDMDRLPFVPQAGGALMDLPNHAILDRGRLVGLWEYEPESQSIVWVSLVPRDKGLTKAVAETEDYVREQLGDARSFSLDSPKSRGPRIELLRANPIR